MQQHSKNNLLKTNIKESEENNIETGKHVLTHTIFKQFNKTSDKQNGFSTT